MYIKTILRDRKNHKIRNYVVDTPKKNMKNYAKGMCENRTVY